MEYNPMITNSQSPGTLQYIHMELHSLFLRLVVWGGGEGAEKLRHVTTARPFGRGLWKNYKIEGQDHPFTLTPPKI
jgi:hypothetical protein